MIRLPAVACPGPNPRQGKQNRPNGSSVPESCGWDLARFHGCHTFCCLAGKKAYLLAVTLFSFLKPVASDPSCKIVSTDSLTALSPHSQVEIAPSWSPGLWFLPFPASCTWFYNVFLSTLFLW